MKEIDPSIPGLWKDAKHDFSKVLGHPQALAFLGIVLGYPFHDHIVAERTTQLPCASLHGHTGNGKSYVAKAAASFYWRAVLDPIQNGPYIKWQHCSPHLIGFTFIADLADHLRIHRGKPVIVDELREDALFGNREIITEATKQTAVATARPGAKASPPIIVSDRPLHGSDGFSCYLHFQPKGDWQTGYHQIRHQDRFVDIQRALADNLTFAHLFFTSILDDTASYITGPGLDGVKSAHLTNVWAAFCAVDSVLGGDELEEEELKSWLRSHGYTLWP